MMTRTEFTKMYAEKRGISQAKAKEDLKVLGELLVECMVNEGEVKPFDGFTFGTKERGPRAGRNPQTGEAMEIPAKMVPFAKFGKIVKDAVK